MDVNASVLALPFDPFSYVPITELWAFLEADVYADKLYVKVAAYEDTVPQRCIAKPAFDQFRSNMLDLILLTKNH